MSSEKSGDPDSSKTQTEEPSSARSSITLQPTGKLQTENVDEKLQTENVDEKAQIEKVDEKLQIEKVDEKLHIENFEKEENGEDEIVYPTGIRVWLAVGALYTAYFLNGLDLTIVAVAVPSITNTFKTVDDIGWYSAAYSLVSSAFLFFFGKACTVISPKKIVLFGLITFTLGSLVCTLAPSSPVFILGRAVCGLGISAVNDATFTLVTRLFPPHKRSIWLSLVGVSQSIGLSIAPVIGGLLIDRFGWRACFGINLPLCPILIIFTACFLRDPIKNPDYTLPLKEKLKRLDLLGTTLVVPSVTCLLIAMQWGGIRYGWQDVRIIVLLVVFACLAIVFAYLQYRLGDRATIPPRIAKRRAILAGLWFSACTNGILATTEYYISIYWQAVRNKSATQSGLLSVSMIIGLSVASVLAGFAIPKVGYFTPFMIATSVLCPIASGLLTTLTLTTAKAKVVALLGFLGFAVGIGNMGPIQAVAAILPPTEVSIGMAIVGFGGGMGSALFISASATLFQSRLIDEINTNSPGVNATIISQTGLSDLRNVIGRRRLHDALTGYNNAVVQTLYMPLALAILTAVGSLAMEWPSVKKKKSDESNEDGGSG